MKTIVTLSVSAVVLSFFGAGTLFFSPQAYAATPTQGAWLKCRETDTFNACCQRFGGKLITSPIGGQGCNWGVIPDGGGSAAGVTNTQPGGSGAATASGDNVSRLPEKKKWWKR